MDMRALGNIVSKRPLATLIIILLITSIFGVYTSQMQMSADMSTFLPNDEIVQAQRNVSEQFGDTDIMEVIFIGNNTVSKGSLQDMLKVQNSLENNEKVTKYLRTPDSPGESIMSPADVIVMGNLTLKFEKSLIRGLNNMSENSEKVNFTAIVFPLSVMNDIMKSYGNIYNNATMLREDAKTIVLVIFTPPSEGNNTDMSAFAPLMENITYTLIYGENFDVKSRILTMLTPPPMQSGNGSEMENPLLDFLRNDMKSNMSMEKKEVSVKNFISAGNFSYYSLNYSNSSIAQGIAGNNQLIQGLNYVDYSVQSEDNDTALQTLDNIISGVSQNIKQMGYVLPYYQDYNRSLSKFLYDLNSGIVTQEDIKSVQENTTKMLSVASGDFKESLMVFNSTFNQWLMYNHIYYDVAYEANSTMTSCRGFISGYDSAVQLNYTLNGIKGMINNDSVANTTTAISNVVNSLNASNQDMEVQQKMVENALAEMNSPYYQWFSKALMDLDYVMKYSRVAPYGVNIFNFIMDMMNSPSQPSGSVEQFQVYYALKHAFDSPVAEEYKYEIQGMYLNEMKLANMMTGAPDLNMSFQGPSLEIPDFNMNSSEKMKILNNMSQRDIENTINGIENYNSSELTDTINATLPLMTNMSENMSSLSSLLNEMVGRINFIYNTTGNASVLSSLKLYINMSETIDNASEGLNYFVNHISYLSGFSYMMTQFSVQFKNMFSKDFDGRTAKAALMLVMLNDTKSSSEDSNQHSKKMERIEEEVGNAVKEVKVKEEVRVMGTYMITEATEKTANETMNILLPVSMILVVIILIVTFRDLIDTLLGLIGLGMAIMWAYGFGVMMNYDFNQISTTVAILLVGLGIDYAIHTILRYREEIRKGNTVRGAMNEMITHLGMGLILATITTMVAFLSNLSSPIPPIQSFGVMNAFGIFGAFIIFTTFVPAVKILIDERKDKKGKLKIREQKEKEKSGSGVALLNRFMALGATGAEKHRYPVVIVILLLTGVSIYAGMNVNTTFDMKDFLPSNLPISDTINFMMDNFNSSSMNNNYVLIQGNVTSPQLIKAVDKTMNSIKDDDYVNYASSTSITTLIKEWSEKNVSFAKMVSENDTDGDGYPDENITAIYDWLYEYGDGKEILHKSNNTYDSMLIIVSSTASTDKENRVLSEEISKDIRPIKDLGYKATLTGTNILTFHILDMLSSSQWNSLIITIITSFIVLTIVFYYEIRSYLLGIISSIPVVIALLWLLGSMYALGIGFNVVTVTITSLTIGLGITYAIHITHRFLEDMRKEENIEKAMRKTVLHTGTSIFGAAATTMAGFGTLMLSSMPPIREFGEIAALSILYSFVLSVFVLPSFLYTWAEYRQKKIINRENEKKYRQLSAGLIFAGIGVYLLAFYLQWIEPKLPSSVASFSAFIFGALAAVGTIVIIIGLEIYYRANGKL